MKHLSRLILIFSIVFAFFLIAPALLSGAFSPYTLMKTGDALDVLTPIVLIPLYWLMYRIHEDTQVSLTGTLAFLVITALWVEGQGMHLSANSIKHLLEEADAADAYRLTDFYDEVLSHYLWHIGIVGLSALLLWRQWKYPFDSERSTLWMVAVAGLIYGFTYFTIVVEANTAPLGVPFALLVAAFGLMRGQAHFRQQPLLAFFFTAYVFALVLFVIWALYWSGSDCGPLLPEFSDPCVGMID